MDVDRKRRFRLITAMTVALLLATAGLYVTYTAFSGATESKNPSEVLAAGSDGETYKVTGTVVKSADSQRDFYIVDTDAADSAKRLHVLYPEGTIPDPFRVGREVVVTGKITAAGTMTADKDSLITKCPSKFSDKVEDKTNVEFTD